jgi:hypothetical protein
VALFLLLFPALILARTAVQDQQQTQQSGSATGSASHTAAAAAEAIAGAQKKDDSAPTQSDRMFYIVPNFAAVSADTQLPRLNTREKFWIATKDSVDYTSFLWAGVLAGQGFAFKTSPELHQGMAGYGRYYWRAFLDQASDAYFTEAIVPAIRHEDPRYYTLGHGGFFRRAGYSLSRLFLTKMDSGKIGFNYSEVVGNGLSAGLSNLYYPPQERGFRKTLENWGTGMESAAINNVVKEFWPDIRKWLPFQK